MKKHIIRIMVFSGLYLLVLSSLVLMLHIFNSFSPMSSHELSIVTDYVIVVFTIGGLFGLRFYYTKKKEK